jgi:hypothetical protein
MVGLVWGIVGLAVTVTAALWVNGIDYMKNEFPDYKGDDLFGKDPLDEESEKNIEND